MKPDGRLGVVENGADEIGGGGHGRPPVDQTIALDSSGILVEKPLQLVMRRRAVGRE